MKKNSSDEKYWYLPEFLNTHEKQDLFIQYYAYYYKDGAPEESYITTKPLSLLSRYSFDFILKEWSEFNLVLVENKQIKGLKFPSLEKILDKFDKSDGEYIGYKVEEMEWDEKIDLEIRNPYKFLPKNMRSHDQRRFIFKDVHENNEYFEKHKEILKEMNYRDGYIYFIDHFMWLLARYGYCLKYKK